MNKFIHNPKGQIIIILLLLYAIVSSIIGFSTSLYLLITCAGFTVLFDITFTYLRSRKLFAPFAAMVTGFIFTLIIDPSATWYQILSICAIAMGTKNFLRISGRHILNPAASGLFIGWILYGLYPSWWGATLYSADNSTPFNILIYLLILAIALVSCYRFRKYNAVLSYILTFAILSPFSTSSSFSLQSIINTVINPGILFYALLMLPEPMTSPVNRTRQVMYGCLVAVVNILLVYFIYRYKIENLPDSSIVALLIGNILFFKYR